MFHFSHNIHHYLKFFEKIRECIKTNTLIKLREVVERQFKDHQNETTRNKHKLNY